MCKCHPTCVTGVCGCKEDGMHAPLTCLGQQHSISSAGWNHMPQFLTVWHTSSVLQRIILWSQTSHTLKCICLTCIIWLIGVCRCAWYATKKATSIFHQTSTSPSHSVLPLRLMELWVADDLCTHGSINCVGFQSKDKFLARASTPCHVVLFDAYSGLCRAPGHAYATNPISTWKVFFCVGVSDRQVLLMGFQMSASSQSVVFPSVINHTLNARLVRKCFTTVQILISVQKSICAWDASNAVLFGSAPIQHPKQPIWFLTLLLKPHDISRIRWNCAPEIASWRFWYEDGTKTDTPCVLKGLLHSSPTTRTRSLGGRWE